MARTFGGLTANQSTVIEAITDGTYFVYNETPAGTQDGSNLSFSLLSNPNPGGSLILRVNGQVLTAGGVDYTLSGSTITYVSGLAPASGDTVKADYTTSPV